MRLTVVIPTVAGRGTYLASALETCLAQPDQDFEILVSDNSPGDAEALVRGLADPRLRYVRPPQFLSMSAHWDFALGHVAGNHVTIIGDDDGLMPGAVAAVAALVAEHGDVAIHHALANYFWPDHANIARRNSVTFFHLPGTASRWQDSRSFLADAAAGRARYLDGPMIYHNFLPMALVRQLAPDGRFFRRAIPDVWSAFAVAANCPRFLSTDRLLTISGTGARSNGSSVYANTGIADDFFRAAAADPAMRPRFAARSVPMLQLDCLLEAAAAFDRPDIAAAIDWRTALEAAALEASAIAAGPTRRAELSAVVDAARQQGVILPVAGRLAGRTVNKLGRRLGLSLSRRPLGPGSPRPDLVLTDAANVADATRALAALLDRPAP
jgi:Glycosyl transferase family 2